MRAACTCLTFSQRASHGTRVSPAPLRSGIPGRTGRHQGPQRVEGVRAARAERMDTPRQARAGGQVSPSFLKIRESTELLV